MICIIRKLNVSDSLAKGHTLVAGMKEGDMKWHGRQIMYKIWDIFTLEKEQQWQLVITRKYMNDVLLLQTVMSHPQHFHYLICCQCQPEAGFLSLTIYIYITHWIHFSVTWSKIVSLPLVPLTHQPLFGFLFKISWNQKLLYWSHWKLKAVQEQRRGQQSCKYKSSQHWIHSFMMFLASHNLYVKKISEKY